MVCKRCRKKGILQKIDKLIEIIKNKDYIKNISNLVI